MKNLTAITALIAVLGLAGCGKPAPLVSHTSIKKTAAMPSIASVNEAEPVAPPTADNAAAPAATATESAASPTAAYDIAQGVWPPAPEREYVVNGQIDLKALTDAMHDWCYYTNRFPTSMEEMVTTKFLAKLPPAPAGKKLAINQSKNCVELVNQ